MNPKRQNSYSVKYFFMILCFSLILGSPVSLADEVEDYRLQELITQALREKLHFNLDRLIIAVKFNHVRLSGKLHDAGQVKKVVEVIYQFNEIQKVKLDLFKLDQGQDGLPILQQQLKQMERHNDDI